MSVLPEVSYRGKVRDLYQVDAGRLIICASDRVSAFDVVFPDLIPGKGILLNRISTRWFHCLRASDLLAELDIEDQLISDDPDQFPEPFTAHPALVDRSVLVRRTRRIDYECVVRGYLAGSGWKDYQRSGQVCGIDLPAGLQEAERLPEPIFTPATKAALGDHDENVSFAHMQSALGAELAERLRAASLAIYQFAADRMRRAGILLCDTKFEFGLLDERIVLIDEALTPDSSRYWNAGDYTPGSTPPGYDKQYIRDFAASSGWDKNPPAPHLPAHVIEKTLQLYEEIEQKILQATAD